MHFNILVKDILEETEEGKYWGNSGASILVMARDTGRVLLGLRSKWVNEPHTWNAPGGGVEKHETPEQGAIREFKEETHYQSFIDDITLAYVFKDGSFSFYNFIGTIKEEFHAAPDWETEKFQWFDLNDLPNHLHWGFVKMFKQPKTKTILDKFKNREN